MVHRDFVYIDVKAIGFALLNYTSLGIRRQRLVFRAYNIGDWVVQVRGVRDGRELRNRWVRLCVCEPLLGRPVVEARAESSTRVKHIA